MVILFHPTLTGRRNALPKESPKRNVQKEKIETDKRRKHFFHTFLYLFGEGTNQRSVPRRSVVPKTPDSKMVLLVRRTLPERERWYRFLFQGEILFSFTHASSPFPLEASGSFFKFNSFLFIYLFFFFQFNFFIYLFVPYKCKPGRVAVWRKFPSKNSFEISLVLEEIFLVSVLVNEALIDSSTAFRSSALKSVG